MDPKRTDSTSCDLRLVEDWEWNNRTKQIRIEGVVGAREVFKFFPLAVILEKLSGALGEGLTTGMRT